MARLLVKATQRNPSNDRDWMPGDVVCIRDNNHVWGREETLPKFWQIDVPDLTEAQVGQLIQEQNIMDDGAPYNVNGKPTMYRRRTWRVMPPLLSQAQINQLNATGGLVITQAEIPLLVASIRKVRNNEVFPGF